MDRIQNARRKVSQSLRDSKPLDLTIEELVEKLFNSMASEYASPEKQELMEAIRRVAHKYSH